MKKGLLFLISLFWLLPAFAQSKDYFKVAGATLEPQGSFPTFYHKRARKATQNINTYLQLAVTKNLMNTDSPVTGHWIYATPINNSKALSISCQPVAGPARHFLFNAATGSVISIQDVFTVNGIAYIKRQMFRKRQEYPGDERFSFNPEGQDKCIKADIQEFLLTPDSLFIYPAHCFNMDSIGNTNPVPGKIAFPMALVGQYLSEYGEVILGITKKPKLKKLYSAGVAGLYRGTIDQEEVFLQLDAPFEKSLNGTIYFTQSRQSLPFEGFLKNNRLDIPHNAGRLSLSIYQGVITGQKKAGNKVLSNFTLNRQ
ncbi:MAG: hypothetical protein JNM21_06940 [Taibaiella sp.]|nr:hypothetical protein [Taibaiella sp.]